MSFGYRWNEGSPLFYSGESQSTDYTQPKRYPPKAPRQQQALEIHEEPRRLTEAYTEAAEIEADTIRRPRETAILNTRADDESREAATRRKEALQKQLRQIKQEWADKSTSSS